MGHVMGVVKSMRPYDTCGGAEKCIQGFAWWRKGEPEGKRRLAKPRRRQEDNIKKYVEETDCEGVGWIKLVRDRDRWRALLNAVMKL